MLDWPQVFLGCTCSREDADIVVFGAPFDGTTSYRPGARFAPAQMRVESIGIETYSPLQDLDLEDMHIADAGDLALPFGNPARVLDEIEQFTQAIYAQGKRPFMIGGEHLVSLGALRAAVQKYKDLHILHFDAHADLREDYMGERLSHATVMNHALDLVGEGCVHSFGIRSGTREEFILARDKVDFYPFELNLADFRACLKSIGDAPVYVTIDLDVLDPSVFPGTGTPEHGGIDFRTLCAAIVEMRSLRIIGADLVELAPPIDPSGSSTAAACKAMRELLLAMGG